MAGHSRSKNGVASLAYVLAIHISSTGGGARLDAGINPAMTSEIYRPYIPVSVTFASVWKLMSKPTSAAEAASPLALGN